MELTELNKKLLNLVPKSDFKLENRTSLQLLKYIEEYAKIIPFNGNSANKENKHWNDFFFMADNTSEKLAELYQGEKEADGELLPQQAFLLAILQLLETPIALFNTLPGIHRSLYYQVLLGISFRPAQPDQVALSVELNTTATEQLIIKGTLFEAGQDEQGNTLQYELDADLLANRGYLSDLYWLRRKEKSQWVTAAPWDSQAQSSLPSKGIRLFSETVLDKLVRGGILITSGQFMDMKDGERKITITFKETITNQNIEAQISSGNKWLILSVTGKEKEITLMLVDKDPAVSAPKDLDNLVFNEPVLRLQGKDSDPLPDVETLNVLSNSVDKTLFKTYHLTPFGYSDKGVSLREYDESYRFYDLYLGITDIKPGQTLSLYWKLKSPLQPTAIFWFYLSQENKWVELNSWVHDETERLYRDGTWQVILPSDASSQATLMPMGRYWIKAEIMFIPPQYDTQEEKPWLYGLINNAMTATLVNVNNISSSHFLTPLPAGSIQHPVDTILTVTSIKQPWASWGGRIAESYDAFFERVAQRLSHRNRALTWGDITKLLKERYASIFDVKYPHNDELTRISALKIQPLTIIPDNRYSDSDDPLRPELNTARRQEMAEWLQQKDSPWAQINILNPQYIDVIIHYEVIFKLDVNRDFGYRQLQLYLRAAYMPWSIDKQQPVVLHNSINYYQLLATIQQQPLVERVTSLTLCRKDSDKDKACNNTESIEAKENEVLILVWDKTNR
ncbi:hypothetical protein [Xenorhabdus stockiae]|nr:hypothetical protein [Xenorhabdus stockiae]